MKNIPRVVLSLCLVALTVGPLSAAAQGRSHGGWGGHHPSYGYRHGGGGWPVWGGLGIGIGLGYGAYYLGRPWDPGVFIVDRAPVVDYYDDGVRAVPRAPLAVPAQPPAPDPVIYPRNGQSPAQTEADRQACNRWATTQPAAMAEASVFQRATQACMEGRGYVVR